MNTRANRVKCMIPSSWQEHRRDDDGELLGYLVPDGELHTPVTVFGFPLDRGLDEYDAGQVLDSVGLSYLADRWLLTVEDRPEPINVQIVEASPSTLRVKSVDYGYSVDYGTVFELPVPETGRLRR